MKSPNNRSSVQPWYRHRWPWLLMAGPFAVVIASIVTVILAIRSDDGLVTDDYYRKGLQINQTLLLSERARQYGLQATLDFTASGMVLRLSSQQAGYLLPARLRLVFMHPTRAGLEQTHELPAVDVHGRYAAQFARPADGQWVVQIEDEAQTWRITGNLVLPATTTVSLGAEPAAN
jgi:hypothetical protein